jgi:hypothetical protein
VTRKVVGVPVRFEVRYSFIQQTRESDRKQMVLRHRVHR